MKAGRKSVRKKVLPRHQWLTPIILPTQEAEFRRIGVEASPGK
jgi:hypothetical protein